MVRAPDTASQHKLQSAGRQSNHLLIRSMLLRPHQCPFVTHIQAVGLWFGSVLYDHPSFCLPLPGHCRHHTTAGTILRHAPYTLAAPHSNCTIYAGWLPAQAVATPCTLRCTHRPPLPGHCRQESSWPPAVMDSTIWHHTSCGTCPGKCTARPGMVRADSNGK